MLLRVLRALFGIGPGDEVDELLLGWDGGSPGGWQAPPARRQPDVQ